MSAPSIVTGSSEFVTVFRSGNWFEAYMAANALEGHEIESIIVNDDICRFRPDAAWIVDGAKVLVSRPDEEDALEVMGLVYTGDPPYVGSFVVVGIAGLGPLALLLIPWLFWRNPRSIPET